MEVNKRAGRVNKRLVATGVAVAGLFTLLTIVPSATAQESATCGRSAADYIGATYIGSVMRTDGAKRVTIRFDTAEWAYVIDPEVGSAVRWNFTDQGITVRLQFGFYYLSTRVCDGFGELKPSMLGGLQEWQSLYTFSATLYRRA